ncbi:MAG: hypothetical protein HYX92_03925 [Chloroflexi bacterium]|nr:hypothetical protein [Chloroflexota bacterium]
MAEMSVSCEGRCVGSVGGANAIRAVVAGLVGTAALTMVMYLAPAMGFPPMDIATLLGTMFIGDPGAAFAPGLAMHFMVGVVLALAYANVFVRYLPGRAWQRGALFGIIPWFGLMVIGAPMLEVVHPAVRAGMMPPPGLFLLGMGSILAPVGSLIGHLVYGAVLGTIYGQIPASRS